ncbi:canalicular multispecific organic anion transporter 1-like [Neolamprologus brichardi]|uniref:canalicular multispecific organic anion transporter 1-like n=1 Tax=Neolamprologus brichardi TaxID=32507 RepID=UPI0016439E25|nr:canalicular multispecific organic anion transporter 1-like [Neolamprologus brichardi]
MCAAALEEYCGSIFWNTSYLERPDPDLPVCVEQTVLVWIPLGFLWLFAPWHLVALFRRPKVNTKHLSKLYICKQLVVSLLFLTAIAHLGVTLGEDFGPNSDQSSKNAGVYYANPVLFAVTWILVLLCHEGLRREGAIDSASISLFWLLLVVCDIFPFQTLLREALRLGEVRDVPRFSLFYISFGLELISLVLSTVADIPPEAKDFIKENPEAGKKDKKKEEENYPNSWLIPTLYKTFKWILIESAFFKLVQDVLTFVSPQLLKLMVSFTQNKSRYAWEGYLYAVLLMVVALLQSLTLQQYFQRCFVLGMRVRTALMAAVYKKALAVSNDARKESTVGETVNLMSADAQRFNDVTNFIHLLWSCPLQIVISIVFLWLELGPSVLAGLGVMVLMVPINGLNSETGEGQDAEDFELIPGGDDAQPDGALEDTVSLTLKRENSIRRSQRNGSVRLRRNTSVKKSENADEPKKGQKLIEKETMETGQVKLAVFLQYLRAMGWGYSAIVFMIYFIQNAAFIGQNLWLSDWTGDSVEYYNMTYPSWKRDTRVGVFGALGVAQGLFVFLGTLLLANASVDASRILHSKLLNNILRVPMVFFDTTPIGRVVNRFAKVAFVFHFFHFLIIPFLDFIIFLSYGFYVYKYKMQLFFNFIFQN